MLLSNLPAKILAAFANAGSKRTVPVASQIGITPGAASFADGFPPLNATPVSAGGIPPDARDFNGILNQITAVQVWQSGGGMFTFDSAWSAANSGYPKGALLLKADGTGLWLNQVDSNTVNPDTVGTNWLSLDGATLSAAAPVASSAEAQAGTLTTKAVTPKGLADTMLAGVSQTLQDLTASRALGTTYTNSTGRPILVSYWTTVSNNGQPAQLSINGVLSVLGAGPQVGAPAGITAIIPNGATYNASATNQSLSKWFELR